jgi:predicted DNA-binding protein YlxM (UPF0122 family)
MDKKQYLSIGQIATTLNVSRQVIYDWIARGVLKQEYVIVMPIEGKAKKNRYIIDSEVLDYLITRRPTEMKRNQYGQFIKSEVC